MTGRGDGVGVEGGDGGGHSLGERLLLIAVRVETKYYIKWDMRS